MKRFYVLVLSILLIGSLCGCSMRNDGVIEDTTKQTTETTQAPTENTTVPKVPETTESRGSTDDKPDDENESLPEEVEKIRRRLLK